MARFIDPIVVEQVWQPGGPEIDPGWVFRAYRPFRYESDVLGATVLIPAGFLSDGASFFLVKGMHLGPPFVHDIGYQTRMFGSQETTDRVIEEALNAVGGYTHAYARAVYEAVKEWGESAWSTGLVRFTLFGNHTRLQGPIVLPLGAEIPAWAFGDQG